MNKNDIHCYDDIIHLPHHEPTTHPRMARENRAAQFSPFAALTGYEDAAREEARLTDEKAELSEDMKDELDAKFSLIQERIDEHSRISVTYFLPDERKAGGRYVTVSGLVKKIDEYERVIVMTDGMKIPIEDVRDIDGDMFASYE